MSTSSRRSPRKPKPATKALEVERIPLNDETAQAILLSRAVMPKELVAKAAAHLLAQRRERDPLPHITLTPTQQAFYTSRTRYRLITSANRGGKTAVCAMLVAACARREHPVWSPPPSVKGMYCIFAPRRDQLVDPWYKKLCVASEFKCGRYEYEPLIPPSMVKAVHNVYGGGKPTPRVIELTNGNILWFSVSGDPRAWEGLEGKGMVLGIVLDENAGSQQLLDECMARLLDAHSHPAVKQACGGGWLVWGATETKVNPAFSEFRRKCRDEHYPDFEEFVIAPDENPAIDMAERKRMRQAISEDAYATRMMADGGAGDAALVFPQFDPDIHWTNEPYEIGPLDCLFIGWDPGVNYSGHVYAAMRPDDPVLHVFAAREVRRATLVAEAQLMASIVEGRRVEWLAYDQAARKIEKTSGQCAIWQLMRELRRCGLVIARGAFKGRSNYTDSVPVVRHWLNERRILLHPGADILRAQFLSFRFSSRAQELKADRIAKSADHAIDALRYLITTGPSWTRHPPEQPRYRPPPARVDDTAADDAISDGATLQAQLDLSAKLADAWSDPFQASLSFAP